MRKCATECYLKRVNCDQKECRLWLDHKEDQNCTLIAVEKNGPMTLKEIALRHNISIVRVKQIADKALLKIKSVVNRDEY
jgi:DNA-directed RNA polymerase sigma subunit (sigma70/sigma32)